MIVRIFGRLGLLTVGLGIGAAAPLAATTIFPTPASANVSCPSGFVLPSVSPDCYFLSMMARDNIHPASESDMISRAHSACDDMAKDTGSDPVVDVAASIRSAWPTLSFPQAALFSGIAAAAYCPSNIRR